MTDAFEVDVVQDEAEGGVTDESLTSEMVIPS